VPPSARIVVATKGFDQHTLQLMTDVAAEALAGHPGNELCALSGPSFAREVASGLPTDVVVASKSAESASAVAEALHSPMFRVYTSKDPIGVEVGGAMKNVLAIAAGACDGLGVALGGDPLTFMGLSGVGDLILTSTGALSRNRSLGMKVAEGIEAAKYLASQRTVAEGFLTARAAWRLAQKLGVDVPITEQVYHVLHEGRPLLDAMKLLLTRAQKDELWGLG
jgi:glycerol-3-phosphate dehydrogenase (NAD(P)+)